MSLTERFESKFIKKGDSECWEWIASISTPGYGQISEGGRKGRNLGAHRVSYELYKGKIPNDLVVDHICRNRRCVNPNHLRLITRVENVMIGDTICAKKLAATHCSNGHEYTQNNIYLYNNHRHCRECRKVINGNIYNKREFKSTDSNGSLYPS